MSNYPKPVGQLWVKKQKDGTAFFSFTINGKNYTAWKNKSKMKPGANPKWPDFEIQEDTYQRTAKTPAEELAEDDCPY